MGVFLGWLHISEMLPSFVKRPALAICDWAGSVGGTRVAVLEFLVRADFVKLPSLMTSSEFATNLLTGTPR